MVEDLHARYVLSMRTEHSKLGGTHIKALLSIIVDARANLRNHTHPDDAIGHFWGHPSGSLTLSQLSRALTFQGNMSYMFVAANMHSTDTVPRKTAQQDQKQNMTFRARSSPLNLT